MRTLAIFVLALLLPAVASCDADLGDEHADTRGVPQAAISTESLDATWSLSLRGVTAQDAFVTTAANVLVADGVVEFAATDGSVGVVFSVENLDPKATACHPSGIILDDACMDRGSFPYVIFDRSPVTEIFLNGHACTTPRDGSAMEMTADSGHVLHRLRAVAPVVCPSGELDTLEVRIQRADVEIGTAPEPQLGGDVVLIDG